MIAVIIAVWAVPLVGSFVARGRRTATAHGIAIVVMAVCAVLSLSLLVAGAPKSVPGPFGDVDRMTAVLLVSSSSLLLAVLVAAPRAGFDAPLLADLLLFGAATFGGLVSDHVVPFLLAWSAALVPLVLEARRSRCTTSLRAAGILGGLAVVPMVAALGVAAVGATASAPGASLHFTGLAASPFVLRWEPVLAPLIVVAAATRAGMFPFHLWAPAVVQKVRLPLALPAAISPLGPFALLKVLLVLFPHFVRAWGTFFMFWGAASCCYGALLAIGRDNVRRQLGFVWVSAVSCVLAGVGTLNDVALTGAFLYQIVGATAVTGLLLVAGGVEARLGTADMRRMGGLVHRVPRLATAYLLLGLAVVSFPATAGFVSEHLLIQGLHEVSPPVAMILLAATAVTGVVLVRSYKRIFLGPPSNQTDDLRTLDDALPRESWVLAALVIGLLLGWFVPAPLLQVRESFTAWTER